MKKLTALFALILTFASISFAQADVCVITSVGSPAYCPAPYHRVYVPARYERRWVPGRGWVVYNPARRIVVYNRYYHRWM